MSVARFTSSNINEEFTYCGHVGKGHPDPDICFAEGRFYLATQPEIDFVSPGPWVEKVTARVGVDTDNDGILDIYEFEKAQDVVISVGGQRPNNLANALSENDIKVLGTSPADIDRAEDRNKFSKLLDKLKIEHQSLMQKTQLENQKKINT